MAGRQTRYSEAARARAVRLYRQKIDGDERTDWQRMCRVLRCTIPEDGLFLSRPLPFSHGHQGRSDSIGWTPAVAGCDDRYDG